MNREEQWLLHEKYQGEKTEDFFTDCERLRSGEPLAYVIGFVPFMNTKIHLDSRPLIPRAETEFWVGKAIEEIKHSGIKAPKILDMCAGSGCIGTAVLAAISDSYCDLVEIDTTHHDTIVKNCAENGIDQTRYKIYKGDLFDTRPGLEFTYDYILSNPPYINQSANTADKSVTDNEPHLALFGGTDGFEIILKLLQNARTYLKPRGVLYIEHEPGQEDLIHSSAIICGLRSFSYKDQYDTIRYSRICVAE